MTGDTQTKGGNMPSWIITDKATGRAVLETYSRTVASAVNLERYRVESALEYLYRINREIREGSTQYNG